MITMTDDDLRKLKELPINSTRRIQIDDRNSTILDTETFNDIAAKAGLKLIDTL